MRGVPAQRVSPRNTARAATPPPHRVPGGYKKCLWLGHVHKLSHHKTSEEGSPCFLKTQCFPTPWLRSQGDTESQLQMPPNTAPHSPGSVDQRLQKQREVTTPASPGSPHGRERHPNRRVSEGSPSCTHRPASRPKNLQSRCFFQFVLVVNC